MRTTLIRLATAGLFVAAGFGQSPDRTFYFTQPVTPRDLDMTVTMLRTVVDLPVISVDRERSAVVANGTVDQMALTEWLFHQLDLPAGQKPASTTPEYRMAGENGDVVRVFRMDPSASQADITAMVTAIRTVADAQRIFPYSSQHAVVARSSIDRVDASEWLFHQLSPPAGQTPSADSPAYHMAGIKGDEVVRVFRLEPSTTNTDLTELITAIRIVTDGPRLFPYAAATAVVMRGPAANVTTAEWMVHELGKPADASQPAATHEYQMPDLTDGVVRVFYLARRGNAADLAALATQVRTTGIQRVFPNHARGAIVLRGRPDQMAPTEALIARFDAAER